MARETITTHGRQLSVERSGTPGGTPVLFLHGITSNAETWEESAARIGDRCDCWALDFTGHGRSDRLDRSPTIEDDAADADAVLGAIGRPALIVGHSLGGITAAHLGHTGHPQVRGLFLEDPPLFLGEPDAFARTVFPQLFTMLRSTLQQLRADGAGPDAYLALARDAPSPMGGVAGDHFTPRQLQVRASAYQQVDPTVLDAAIDGRLFVALDPHKPLPCPVTLLAANEALGAAFLGGDAERLLRGSPHAEVIAFDEVGHGIHSSTVSEARFLDELDRFVTANT